MFKTLVWFKMRSVVAERFEVEGGQRPALLWKGAKVAQSQCQEHLSFFSPQSIISRTTGFSEKVSDAFVFTIFLSWIIFSHFSKSLLILGNFQNLFSAFFMRSAQPKPMIKTCQELFLEKRMWSSPTQKLVKMH